MRQWKGRTNEPLFWALFGAGGFLGVWTMPVLILIFALLVPFGAFGGAAGTYAKMAPLLTNWFVLLIVFVILGLLLWHSCHRTFHTLHDLKVHPPEIVRWLIYAIAILAPVIGFALCITA